MSVIYTVVNGKPDSIMAVAPSTGGARPAPIGNQESIVYHGLPKPKLPVPKVN